MKNLLLKLFAIILLAGFFHACNETLVEEQQPVDDLELKSAQNNKQSYIVVLEDAELNAELSGLKGYANRKAAALKAASKVLKRAGIADGQIGHVYGTAIKGFSVKIPPGQLRKLENSPSVKYVEEDQIVTLIHPIFTPHAKPPGTPGGGPDKEDPAPEQETPWGISRVNGGIDGTGKTAWVIDTGIDLDHPDLNVNTDRGKSFIDGTSSPDDDNGHGTHVAGTIAAIDNDQGVIGVAAGATVIPVKVLDRNGSGTLSGIIEGVDYVAAHGSAGDVANMSLGGSAMESLDEAVFNASEKEIYFSLAAGNESDDANTHSPARANGTYIYTISAMDDQDYFASWSNYGNPPVDFCEPGVDVVSTYKDGSYAEASGTSMAAPHMAGILLLGSAGTDGYVNGDPDGEPDPIGVVGDGTSTNSPPSASFTYSVSDLTVDFTDTSSDPDGSIASWDWDFDGSTSTAQNPEHTFNEAGTYSVTLTVTDDDGATDTAAEDVTVSSSSENVVPTVTNLSLSDASNPAWKRVEVDWTVNDNDGDLKEVYIELFLSEKLIDTATNSVSGNSASGTNELGQKGGSSGTYTVVITVTDGAGNTTDDQDTIGL